LVEYAGLIAKIGLTSFGGGVSGWMMRVVVHERRWIDEADFVTGLSLSQVFPGINVLNLAIWLGYRLHGGVGALAGALAMIVPPGLVLIARWAVRTPIDAPSPIAAAATPFSAVRTHS
jgi:chromate transporter